MICSVTQLHTRLVVLFDLTLHVDCVAVDCVAASRLRFDAALATS